LGKEEGMTKTGTKDKIKKQGKLHKSIPGKLKSINGNNHTYMTSNLSKTINIIVDELCESQSYDKVYFRDSHDVSMPSVKVLKEVIEKLRMVLFPGYFGEPDLTPETMPYYVGSTLVEIGRFLTEQFMSGFCVSCFKEIDGYCRDCGEKSETGVAHFLAQLPRIRALLASDVQAAFNGDPAAKSLNEIIFCYPSIKALTSYRIAHELHRLKVPLLPRIITEMAHSETGIDIHPGAQIKDHFFIDHGTGTVIGATCEIGRNVRIYQGVTLGAKSFPLDEDGNPIKGIPRHPIVEDDVTIYSGATILGRVTIGKGSVIGGNIWITSDVPQGTQVTQRPPKQIFIAPEI
jgi:serine O-acetyltransferase